MPRSSIMRILMIAISVLMLTGVGLATWALATEDERSNIKIDLSEGKTETVKFESLSLVPGESCEYNMELNGDYAEIYDVSLVFVDKDKDMTLKHYARVKIMLGEEVVCDELLADVFENDDIVLDVDLTEKKSTELKIVYYLPIEIGNEAKNAEAVFELQLTASNE